MPRTTIKESRLRPHARAAGRGNRRIAERSPGLMASAPLWVVLLLLACATATAGDALRDPTRPPPTSAAPAPVKAPVPLRLDFVVSSGDRQRARINGQWVSEGASVDGATVRRIEADRVTVRRSGRTSVLTLGGAGIRKSTAEQ